MPKGTNIYTHTCTHENMPGKLAMVWDIDIIASFFFFFYLNNC